MSFLNGSFVNHLIERDIDKLQKTMWFLNKVSFVASIFYIQCEHTSENLMWYCPRWLLLSSQSIELLFVLFTMLYKAVLTFASLLI